MHEFCLTTQDAICSALEAVDGGTFREDTWTRPGGGGGRSRVLQDGRVFEKAGVNVSHVHGALTDEALAALRVQHPDVSGREFTATGISLVLHPHHPMAPTVHLNYRAFELGDGTWWFGGGSDLTPSYLFERDAEHFHARHKAACDAHDPSFYPRFKKWADEYFWIAHRGEARGVGGIFFDHLADRSRDALFAFVQDCAAAFLPAYLPILRRRIEMPFTEAEKRWQQLRRGRYVEFNLVYDRGTLFGLKTDARVESVLMSLPLTARWEAALEVDPKSREGRLLEVLRHPRDWISP